MTWGRDFLFAGRGNTSIFLISNFYAYGGVNKK